MNASDCLMLVRELLSRAEPCMIGLAVLLLLFALLGIDPLFPSPSANNRSVLLASFGKRGRPIALQLPLPTLQIVVNSLTFIIAFRAALTQLPDDYEQFGLYDRMTLARQDEAYREDYLNSLFVARPRPLSPSFYDGRRRERLENPDIPWHFIAERKRSKQPARHADVRPRRKLKHIRLQAVAGNQ